MMVSTSAAYSENLSDVCACRVGAVEQRVECKVSCCGGCAPYLLHVVIKPNIAKYVPVFLSVK